VCRVFLRHHRPRLATEVPRAPDRRVLRLIQRWLDAGAVEDGAWTACDEGTPQGASISTLLANVYLHYVFDLWAHRWRGRHAHGDLIVVRYADDFLVGFEHRDDAERFLADLRERLGRFGLELASEKTRLIEFGRFAARDRARRGEGRPETFEFLGFTHICARTRGGRFRLRRTTSKKRLRAKLSEVKAELRRRRHLPIPVQGRWLASVIRGHCNYYAVPDNSAAVASFRYHVVRHWRRSLRRRSQRSRLDWERMNRLAVRWLPRSRPAPLARATLRRHDPRQEPSALDAHAGICAGGRRQRRSLPRSTGHPSPASEVHARHRWANRQAAAPRLRDRRRGAT
jgi:RNA-directed DNA polymerase